MRILINNKTKNFCISLMIVLFCLIMNFQLLNTKTVSATKKVQNEPISVVTTEELSRVKKIGKDQIVIEKMECVIDDKYKYGHVVGHKDWIVYYGHIKDKRLKKGVRVKTYFPCDFYNNSDTYDAGIARYDYIRVKDKKTKKWKWVLVYVNSY